MRDTGHRSDRGFTLVEIGIVIAILCIIAIAVAFTVRGTDEIHGHASCADDARTLTPTGTPCP